MISRFSLLAAVFMLGACSAPTPDPAPVLPAEEAEPADTAVPVLAEPAPAPVREMPAPAAAELAQTSPQTAPELPQAQPAVSQQDARLVGVWANENIINSGGSNFASYTTVMTMEIRADGSILQYTESVGGGGDWSYDSKRTTDFEGQWRGDGQTLSVYGMGLPDYTPAATYEFSGQYLVTHSNDGRLIWQRRG